MYEFSDLSLLIYMSQENIGGRSFNGPTITKRICRLMSQVLIGLISALRWLLLRLEPDIEGPTTLDIAWTPGALQGFSTRLESNIWAADTEDVVRTPDAPRMMPQRLPSVTDMPPYLEYSFSQSPMADTELLIFDSPRQRPPRDDSPYDYYMVDESGPSSAYSSPSPILSAMLLPLNSGLYPYITTAGNGIAVSTDEDSLTATIVIHGSASQYDLDVLWGHFDKMAQISAHRDQPINLDIVFEVDRNANGAYRLMESFLEICKEDIGSLTVEMKTSLTFADLGTSSTRLQPLDLQTPPFPKLRHFSLTSGAGYLPSPWLSLSKLPFAQLKSLDLHCPLAVTDCIQILSSCERIVRFTASKIEDRSPAMRYYGSGAYKTLHTLKELTIYSSVDLEWLFDTIEICGLKKIDFSFAPGTNSRLDVFQIDWSQVKDLNLDCSLTQRQLGVIGGKCDRIDQFTQHSHRLW